METHLGQMGTQAVVEAGRGQRTKKAAAAAFFLVPSINVYAAFRDASWRKT